MKKFTHIVFVIVLILTNQMITQQWWTEGSAGFSADMTEYNSLKSGWGFQLKRL